MKDVKILEILGIADGNVKWYSACGWKIMAVPQKIKQNYHKV